MSESFDALVKYSMPRCKARADRESLIAQAGLPAALDLDVELTPKKFVVLLLERIQTYCGNADEAAKLLTRWVNAVAERVSEAQTNEIRPHIEKLAREWFPDGTSSIGTNGKSPLYGEPPTPNVYLERAALLNDLVTRVCAGASNIIVVQGIGGIGKSTLAAKAVKHPRVIEQFPDGRVWLEIGGGMTDAAALLSRVGAAFGDSAAHYNTVTAAQARLASILRGKAMLIVLDDVWERDALEPLRRTLDDRCRLLVTTRQTEIINFYPAGKLPLPQLEIDEGVNLIGLWQGRAPDAPNPYLDSERDIVRELDGHTLAVQLAGAWINMNTPESAPHYLTKLRAARDGTSPFALMELDATDKNNNLELCLRLSYDDLTVEQAVRFRQLGVFAPEGWFSADAADTVWDGKETYANRFRAINGEPLILNGDAAEPTLDAFHKAGLVERVGYGRYSLHPLMRTYALALLKRDGAQAYDAIRRRHLYFYTALAHQHRKKQDYLGLDRHRPNLDTAFTAALTAQPPDPEGAYWFANVCADYLSNRGQFRTRLDWTRRAADGLADHPDKMLWAAAQNSLGVAYQQLAQMQTGADAAESLERAIAAYTAALDYRTADAAPLNYAMTQNNLGSVYQSLARHQDAAANLKRAVDAYTEALRFWTPDAAPMDYAATQNNLGSAYQEFAAIEDGVNAANNLKRAVDAFREALRFWTPDAAPMDYAMSQYNLGITYENLSQIEERAANLDRAEAAYREALCFYTLDAAPYYYATTQHNLGVVHERRGEYATAIVCYREAEAMYRKLGIDHEVEDELRSIAINEQRIADAAKDNLTP